MAAPKEYTPLPGRGMRRQGVISVATAYSRLYLGGDHLLMVDTTGFTEEYKRFYYRDIQAFVFRRTGDWHVGNIILGLLSALLLWGIAAVDDPAIRITLFILGLVVFIPFLVNLLAGPTCVCSLRTAVQTEELPSLGRLRRARKVLEMLRPRIEAAQGALTAGELQARAQAAAQLAPAFPAPVPAASRPMKPPRTLTRSNGRAHKVLFWIALADVPYTGLHLLTDWKWMEGAAMLMILGELVAGIVAIVRQQGTDLPRFLRALPWVTTITLPALFFLGIVYGIVLAASGTAEPEAFEQLGKHSLFTLTFTFLSTTMNGCVGLLGLLRLQEYLRRATTPPAVPPAIP